MGTRWIDSLGQDEVGGGRMGASVMSLIVRASRGVVNNGHGTELASLIRRGLMFQDGRLTEKGIRLRGKLIGGRL